MNRTGLTLLLVAALAGSAVADTTFSPAALTSMAEHYRLFSVLGPDADGNARYIYADDGAYVHAYTIEDRKSVLAWETSAGSEIRSLMVISVSDARQVIVVATAAGKIFAYSAQTFSLLRENLMEPFETISAFTLADIDGDPEREAIIVGVKNGDDVNRIWIYDGINRLLLWRSDASFTASEILVANLDDDVQPEIILNTGAIIDSRFHTVETSSYDQGGFGVRIKLLDINGDGIPEIFGEGAGQGLIVYDPYSQRKLW